MTIETTNTAATSASRLSHFGSTATSASQTPSTTEASTAATVPQVTAESSAARPVLRRYAAAIATIRNISIPSRSVTRRTWPMVLGGEDQLAGLWDAQSVFAPVRAWLGTFAGAADACSGARRLSMTRR